MENKLLTINDISSTDNPHISLKFIDYNDEDQTLLINYFFKIVVYDTAEFKKILDLRGPCKILISKIFKNLNILFFIDENLYNIMIWDYVNKKMLNVIKSQEKIISIKINYKYIVVVTLTYIFIYKYDNNNFGKIYLESKMKTVNNNDGLTILSKNFIIYPAFLDKGNLIIDDHTNRATIKCFSSSEGISHFCITEDESLLAISNLGGTMIKIFNIEQNNFISEFKRGFNKAKITSLAFSNDNKLLALSSDRGTVHIYVINKSKEQCSFLSSILKLTSSITFKKEKCGSILKFVPQSINDSEKYILNIFYENKIFYRWYFNTKDIDKNNEDEKIYTKHLIY